MDSDVAVAVGKQIELRYNSHEFGLGIITQPDNHCVVNEIHGIKDDDTVVIPETYNGNPVTAIAIVDFPDWVKTLMVPQSVQRIRIFRYLNKNVKIIIDNSKRKYLSPIRLKTMFFI